jgi:hypothetical protein
MLLVEASAWNPATAAHTSPPGGTVLPLSAGDGLEPSLLPGELASADIVSPRPALSPLDWDPDEHAVRAMNIAPLAAAARSGPLLIAIAMGDSRMML